MLPVLEKTLGFNGEMLGLITALYVLFDRSLLPQMSWEWCFSVILSRMFRSKKGL